MLPLLCCFCKVNEYKGVKIWWLRRYTHHRIGQLMLVYFIAYKVVNVIQSASLNLTGKTKTLL